MKRVSSTRPSYPAQELHAYSTIRAQKGLKVSKKRNAVVEYFMSQDRHFTVEQLYDELKVLPSRIGYSTVYRTMKLLVKCGLAREHRFGEEDTRYEPVHSRQHHDHLVCQHCGKIIEFIHNGIENFQREVARKHNFSVQSHELQIFGVCQQCQKRRKRKLHGSR